MCTVSYVPVANGALICSNRDEKRVRSSALPPKWYQVNGSRLLFPKDAEAQGSWIAMKPNGNMAVLLNGAWEKHHPQYPYRKSRGLIFLEIVSADDMFQGFESVQLNQIEPFTIILFQNGILQENRWNGDHKSSQLLPVNEPRIWSSVTLYDSLTIQKRQNWFQDWLNQHPAPTVELIQAFHELGGNGDRHNDLQMNRQNEMLTVSITCMQSAGQESCMYYTDLQTLEKFESRFDVLTLTEIAT